MLAIMKAIQITLDESLLADLDNSPAVAARGRSAVLREAAADWLAREREAQIAAAYRRAYAGKPDDRQTHWPVEAQAWPDE